MNSIKFIGEPIKNLIKTIPLVSFYRSRSFSQVWEDRLIAQHLTDFQGSYVDVGAGMPIWGSNTYLFYKKGWSGVTIDPISSNIRMQKVFRSRDKQYKALISNIKNEIIFYHLSPWELSTTDNELAQERILKGAVLKSTEKNSTISLEMVYAQNPIKRPAILSIDVEGAEMEVLQSNNWDEYIPDLICIEELTNPLQKSQIRNFLTSRDFDLVAYNGLSSIYIWNQTQFRKS